eukprot:CAMPEP_0116102186 /NCGR_PEP_ID=MMETSP0327-20121206/13212_1 /TAXON_ID=44447 /ORGANISM="Pseudo-nitzschia delicatissima, Strain B596" /LENGTH=1598 /DNA_ID=CAMNT_0003594203 /DNA_START=119 /DNA_END=4915 /DNA_ORIENTATION=-
MRYSNGTRLLLLLSVLFLCHAVTVTRRRNSSGSHRHLEDGLAASSEENDSDEKEDFQPKSLSLSKIEAIIKAMDPPPNCTSTLFDEPDAQHHNRLECFLWHLKLEIPAQEFKKGILKITVHDMLCTNFRLHGLNSNSSIPGLTDEPNDWSALRLSVQKISATCQGQYHATPGLSGNVLATVSQSSPASPALGLRVGVLGKESSSAAVKLPVSFETKHCGTSLGCTDIKFSGSISARMIQAFSGRIGKYITQALQEQVCPLMTKTADPIVTAYLKEFDDLIRPYLEETKAVTDTTDSDLDDSIASTGSHHVQTNDGNDNATNLVDYPVVHSALSFLNEQLRYHLQTGWIPLPPPSYQEHNFRRMSQECIDSFRGISGWIISILGRRPRIPMPQNLRHIVFPIPAEIGKNGTIAIDISEVVVEGLDEMDTLQVLAPLELEPLESKDLSTKIVSQKGFFVVLPIKMEIRWPTMQEVDISARPTLVESFQLTINVTQIDASLSSMVRVIDWESTSLLQVVDAVQNFVESRNLRDLACLFRTLHSVQLSTDGSFEVHNILIDAIRLSRDKKEVPDGSLEADFDHAINTILDLFLSDYADLWTHLVRGLVRGPGSRRLNEYVESWIQRHSHIDEGTQNDGKCPSSSRSPGQWVNFTKFEILNTFNRYLDHSHTKKSLNSFLQCLAESIEEAVDGDDDPTQYHLMNRDDFIDSSEVIGGVFSMLLGNDMMGSSKVNLPTFLSELLNDNMNVFVESGKSLRIQDDNFETKVTLSRMDLRNWDSIQRLQIMRPSGDTSLVSSLAFGTKASLEDFKNESLPLSWMATNAIEDAISSRIEPPEIAVVVDIDGSEFSGQINFTLFGSLVASTEVNVDYDLNRLENLTISRLLDEINCVLLPAMQIRFMPGTTDVAFGEYFGANLTAAIDGRNFSLSTNDFPRFFDLSNDALSWSQEFTRTAANYVVEKLIETSANLCPGVVSPENGHRDNSGHDEKQIYWLWRDSTALWLLVGLAFVMQGGLVFVYSSQQPAQQPGEVVGDPTQTSHEEIEPSSRTTRLLSTYQELMSHPSPKTVEQCQGIKPNNSLDEHIIHDICEEWNEEEEAQGILEDQLFDELNISLFDSDKIPEVVKYVIPVMIIGTIVLFVCSNLSVGASVDLSVGVGQRSIGIPGLFQFSLANTVSEMYQAGIYPLLILVLCFSGLWPYVKLLCMLYSWIIPCGDQHKQERRLLTLDAMGKYSLVDNYVLILFVVAFRFHLKIVDNLGIDVYVTPIYGFFSFLFATCLSLGLGHAVLFFHRETMHQHDDDSDPSAKSLVLNHGFKAPNGNSQKRLSRIAQGLLLLSLLATFGFLVWGFVQKSFTFEIGGLAGIMLGEDASKTSYSVLSLGAALPSSVEDPESPSIVFLQGTFFFFTVVTPILCLILILVLMLTPLTLKWQRYLLVAAEIANSWSAVEVFLLSILAALFQISTFASFMIGDKCDEINILAEKIFGEKDDTVCFTVDASVESNCWYLLVGALANFFLVTFCLGFAETAVEEKGESSCRARETTSGGLEVSPNQKMRDLAFIHKLLGISFFRCVLFASVAEPVTEQLEEVEFEPLVEQEGRGIDAA